MIFLKFFLSDLFLCIAQNEKYLFYAKHKELPNQWVKRAEDFSHRISRTVFSKYFSNMYLVRLESDKTSLFSKCFLCYFETILCSGRCHVFVCAYMLICGSLNQEWRIYKLSIKILVHALKKW